MIQSYPIYADFGEYQVLCCGEGDVFLLAGPCSLLLLKTAIGALEEAMSATSWRFNAPTEKLHVALGNDQSALGMQLAIRRDEAAAVLDALRQAFAASDRIRAEAAHA